MKTKSEIFHERPQESLSSVSRPSKMHQTCELVLCQSKMFTLWGIAHAQGQTCAVSAGRTANFSYGVYRGGVGCER